MFLENQVNSHQKKPLLKYLPARLFDEFVLLRRWQGVKPIGYYANIVYLNNSFFPCIKRMRKKIALQIHGIVTALSSMTERVGDKLRINPASICRFSWYPLREKVEILKWRCGLNNHDVYALAGNGLIYSAVLRPPTSSYCGHSWHLVHTVIILKRSAPMRMEYP